VTIQEAINVGLQHQQAGRVADAETVYRQIIAQQPRNPDAPHLLGLLLGQTGRYDPALQFIRRALEIDPSRSDFYAGLSAVLSAQGQFMQAAQAISRALTLKPHEAEYHFRLGHILMQLGRLDDALAAFDMAAQISPGAPAAHNAVGIAFRRKGQLNAAIAWYGQALSLEANFPDAHNNLGEALYQNGQLDAAIVACRRALELRPKFPEALNNLGNALRKAGRLEEAVETYQKALAQRPDWPETHDNLGNAYFSQGELDLAAFSYANALAITPNYAPAQMNQGLLHLLRGDFEHGWDLYESRLKVPGATRPKETPAATWDGSDLRGKRILVLSDQGFGDCIQFIRYAPMLAERGGQVVLACQEELLSLLDKSGGVSQTVKLNGPMPAADVYCPLLSLPRIFKTDLQTIPARTPYLSADAARRDQWRDRIGDSSGRLRIGLAWAGRPGDREELNRSIPLSMLAPLAEARRDHDRGALFYSLQLGDAAAQTAGPPAGMELIDLTGQIKDFSDTAAMIENLDLVITVDTAVAHLAGALGKPVWLLLAMIPDWRWMLKRADSPWYPTMRLFRQTRRGDWDAPLRELAEALRGF